MSTNNFSKFNLIKKWFRIKFTTKFILQHGKEIEKLGSYQHHKIIASNYLQNILDEALKIPI